MLSIFVIELLSMPSELIFVKSNCPNDSLGYLIKELWQDWFIELVHTSKFIFSLLLGLTLLLNSIKS